MRLELSSALDLGCGQGKRLCWNSASSALRGGSAPEDCRKLEDAAYPLCQWGSGWGPGFEWGRGLNRGTGTGGNLATSNVFPIMVVPVCESEAWALLKAWLIHCLQNLTSAPRNLKVAESARPLSTSHTKTRRNLRPLVNGRRQIELKSRRDATC
jgi:hypothetical protein